MSIWTRILLVCVAAIPIFCGMSLLQWQHVRQLENELLEARQDLEDLHIDHRDTMDAITRAIDAREAIHEQARLREERLRKAMENDPLADVPVPDSWGLRFTGNESCEISAAGDSASGCGDSGSGQNQDGR